MSKHHKVKSQHWLNGILHTKELFFESLEEALAHINDNMPHSAKVYNNAGELVHVESSVGKPVPVHTESYA